MSELFLSEEQARRLWERAAQLQAEAAENQEKPEDGGEGEGKRRRLIAGVEEEGEGYSLDHIKQAGLEVGIQSDFLDLALAEEAVLELEGGGEEGGHDRALKRLLGDQRRALEIRRRFSYPARAVWLSLEDALLSEPNNFDLLDVRGIAPSEGGVAIFEAPSVYQHDGSLRYWSAAADTKRYLVRVTPDENGIGCEVLVRVPLRRSRRIAGGVGVAFVSGLGILGGWGGLGIAGLLAGSGGMAAVPLALLMAGGGLGGAAGVGVGTRLGWNATYQWVLRKLTRNLEKILTRVDRDVQRDMEARLPPA